LDANSWIKVAEILICRVVTLVSQVRWCKKFVLQTYSASATLLIEAVLIN